MPLVVSLPAIVLRGASSRKGSDPEWLKSRLPSGRIASDDGLLAISDVGERELRDIFSALQAALDTDEVCWLETKNDGPGWLLIHPGEGNQVTVRRREYYPLPQELLVVPVLPV